MLKKFLEDNGGWMGNLAEGILARANACAVRGIIPESLTREIMENDFLAGEFHRVVFFDVNHTNLIAATMTKNNEEDRKNIPSENMSKALALICQAKALIEKDQEHSDDARKYLARACCEALDAVCYAISEEINKAEEKDGKYAFEHLFKAILGFGEYYGADMTDSMIHSIYFTHGMAKLLPNHSWTETL